MENEEKPKIAIINQTGDVLCLINGVFTFQELSEVTLDNLFIFWGSNMDDLEEYFYNIYGWKTNPDPTLGEINLRECSILEVKVDWENQTFWFE